MPSDTQKPGVSVDDQSKNVIILTVPHLSTIHVASLHLGSELARRAPQRGHGEEGMMQVGTRCKYRHGVELMKRYRVVAPLSQTSGGNCLPTANTCN
jgi:hypothetical protein